MKISLRTVNRDDWDYILSLRNEDEFRPNFYEQHVISKKEHYDYLEKQLENPLFFNWIICNDSQDVGYVRILDSDVSIIIDKKSQAMSIGTTAIRLLESKAKSLGIKKLVGRMMVENTKSEKIFRKNNFKLKMYWYEKNLDQNNNVV